MSYTKFEKPIKKKASEMKSGEIIRFEYGVDGNWREAVFESCNPDKKAVMTEIHFHWIGSDKSEKMYDSDNIDTVTFEVVGVEK